MPLRFDLVTIFPAFFSGPLDHGILRRAREAGVIEVAVHDLRDSTHDRHRTVDDRPFGGGEGMLLKPEPLFEAVERILAAPRAALPPATAIVLLSASGKLFRQPQAQRLTAMSRIILLCGRYEGVDERVSQHLATDELSIGDFVLSGGELPAALVMDAVTRLLPGALGNEASSVNESFSSPAPGSTTAPAASAAGILDCPHYTRPQSFRGWSVPDVLVSGNHAQVARWRRRMALEKTLRNRPELLASAAISDDDRKLLDDPETCRET